MKQRNRRERVDETKLQLRDIDPANLEVCTRYADKKEWLQEAIRMCQKLLGCKDEKWIEVPHLRCVYFKEKSLRFISTASGRVRNAQVNGGWIEVLTVCFITEKQNKDVLCINVRNRRTIWRSDIISDEKEVILCSCDLRRERGQLDDS